MKTRCKPGDLAIVEFAVHPWNVGRIVRVLQECDRDGAIRYAPDITVWLVQCSIPMKWTVGRKLFAGRVGPVPDANLKPIRGGPVDDGEWHEFTKRSAIYLGLVA